MPWLVVLGHASWIRRGRDGNLQRFTAGIHEVDAETAQAARQSKLKSLVVTDHKPELEPDKEGPLSLEDVQVGRNWGVAIKTEVHEETVEDIGRYDFTCRLCPPNENGPVGFASRGRLERHIMYHH